MQKIRKILSAVFPEKWWQIRATLLTVTLSSSVLNFSSRHDFLTSNQFQLVHLGIIDVAKIEWYHDQTMDIVYHYQNMQYAAKPRAFLALLIIQNGFLWILNDPAWPGTLATCSKTLSTITICNTKSIQQAKHLKMAENLTFGSGDHSKMHFPGAWMILNDLVTLPIVKKHLVLWQYAISSWSNTPKSG